MIVWKMVQFMKRLVEEIRISQESRRKLFSGILFAKILQALFHLAKFFQNLDHLVKFFQDLDLLARFFQDLDHLARFLQG